MKPLLTLVTAAALLAGCQTGRYEGDEGSPYYLVPAGTRLVLHRELTVPAHSAGVLLQGGKVVAGRDVNFYQPHCKLEVREVRDTPQTVQPDEFTVTRASQELLHSVRAAPRHPAPVLVRRVGDDSGGPGVQTFATRLRLASARQPQVLYLTCGHWDYPQPHAAHLSIRQIRQALGELLTLRLPPRPAA